VQNGGLTSRCVQKRVRFPSTALFVLCFFATLAQNKQLRSGGLAGR